MEKINLWPLFFGSVIVLPFVMVACTHYGWTLAWSGFCLTVCITYEIYYKIKNKKLKS